jgi:hypothetical protein
VDILDLPTPLLLVERGAFDRNVATMVARWPGTRLRPYLKAFKSTALAQRLAADGLRNGNGRRPLLPGPRSGPITAASVRASRIRRS